MPGILLHKIVKGRNWSPSLAVGQLRRWAVKGLMSIQSHEKSDLKKLHYFSICTLCNNIVWAIFPLKVITTSFQYISLKSHFNQLSRCAVFLIATTSIFTENYLFEKKHLLTYFQSKIKAVTIFSFEFWSITYKKIMFGIFFLFKWVKRFFFQNIPSILDSFGWKMVIKSHFFCFCNIACVN